MVPPIQGLQLPRLVVQSPERDVRAGAIRVEDPDQWSPGDVPILQNQEAKKIREISSLIFDSPVQYDYEIGVEVRTLLPTEAVEEIDGSLAVIDVDAAGHRYVKFWIDSARASLVLRNKQRNVWLKSTTKPCMPEIHQFRHPHSQCLVLELWHHQSCHSRTPVCRSWMHANTVVATFM